MTHVHIYMPHVEHYQTAEAMVLATGAVQVGSHEFAIEGSLGDAQVEALAWLREWRDPEGERFDIEVRDGPAPAASPPRKFKSSRLWK